MQRNSSFSALSTHHSDKKAHPGVHKENQRAKQVVRPLADLSPSHHGFLIGTCQPVPHHALQPSMLGSPAPCSDDPVLESETSSPRTGPYEPNTHRPFLFVFFEVCFETVASWRHCIDYNTTSASLSIPVGNLCRARVWGESLSHKKNHTTKKTVNGLNTSQLFISLRYLYKPPITTLSILLHCRPSLMGSSDKTLQQWSNKLTARERQNQGTLPRVADANLATLFRQQYRSRILPQVHLGTQTTTQS